MFRSSSRAGTIIETDLPVTIPEDLRVDRVLPAFSLFPPFGFVRNQSSIQKPTTLITCDQRRKRDHEISQLCFFISSPLFHVVDRFYYNNGKGKKTNIAGSGQLRYNLHSNRMRNGKIHHATAIISEVGMRGRHPYSKFILLALSVSLLLFSTGTSTVMGGSVALAHAFVIGSDPIDGSTVATVPRAVRIFFASAVSPTSIAYVFTP